MPIAKLGVAFALVLPPQRQPLSHVEGDRKPGSISHSRHLKGVFDSARPRGHGTSVVCEYGCCVTRQTGICDNMIHEWNKWQNARLQMSQMLDNHSAHLIELHVSSQIHLCFCCRLLVGAPKAKALRSQKAKVTGGLYSCDMSSADCDRVNFDDGGEISK